MAMERITLAIRDLNCGGGALEVERALEQVPGVVQVYVNPSTECAHIECDRHVSLTALRRAVERAGFRAGIPVARL